MGRDRIDSTDQQRSRFAAVATPQLEPLAIVGCKDQLISKRYCRRKKTETAKIGIDVKNQLRSGLRSIAGPKFSTVGVIEGRQEGNAINVYDKINGSASRTKGSGGRPDFTDQSGSRFGAVAGPKLVTSRAVIGFKKERVANRRKVRNETKSVAGPR